MECCSSVNTMSASCPGSSSYSLDSCDSRRSSSLSVSSISESMKEKEDPTLKSREPIRTLYQEQRSNPGQISLLGKRSAELNYNVEIKRTNESGKSFIVDFEDRRTAMNALAEANTIGLELSKKRAQRPSPENLVRYKALSKL